MKKEFENAMRDDTLTLKAKGIISLLYHFGPLSSFEILSMCSDNSPGGLLPTIKVLIDRDIIRLVTQQNKGRWVSKKYHLIEYQAVQTNKNKVQ